MLKYVLPLHVKARILCRSNLDGIVLVVLNDLTGEGLFTGTLAQLDFASVPSHLETKVLFLEMTMTATKLAYKPILRPRNS